MAQFLLLHRKEPRATVILCCVLVIDQEFYLHLRGKIPNLGLTQVYRVQHLNLHVHCTLNYVLLIKKILCLFSAWTKLELNFAKGLVLPARFFKLAPTFSASKESMLAILSVPMDTNNYPCVNNKVTMLTCRWVVRVIAITSVNPQTQHRYDHLISGTSHISLYKSVIITTTVLLLGFFWNTGTDYLLPALTKFSSSTQVIGLLTYLYFLVSSNVHLASNERWINFLFRSG